MSADGGPAPIPLADLMEPWPMVQLHGTEWLYRAVPAIKARLAVLDSRPDPKPKQEALAIRMRQQLARIETELDDRLVRTLHELPDLTQPPTGGWRVPGYVPPRRVKGKRGGRR